MRAVAFTTQHGAIGRSTAYGSQRTPARRLDSLAVMAGAAQMVLQPVLGEIIRIFQLEHLVRLNWLKTNGTSRAYTIFFLSGHAAGR